MTRTRYLLLGVLLAVAGGALAVSTTPTVLVLQRIIGISGSTAATSLIQPQKDATLYSLLGRNQAGPGLQCRWDSGSANRYCDFGIYDNAGVWGAQARVADGNGMSGTFTATVSAGCGAATNNTVAWSRSGNLVTLTFAATNLSCTATGGLVSITLTGVPANITPATTHAINAQVVDSAIGVAGTVSVTSSSTLVLTRQSNTAFAAATAGVWGSATVTYSLQ